MIPFQTTNWNTINAETHTGETGSATWKTLQFKGIRVRMVEYSAGYKADHWCPKGHIIYCVEGEMLTQLKDGSKHILTKGMSYQTSDDEINPHTTSSINGCKLFIVDGDFLS